MVKKYRVSVNGKTYEVEVEEMGQSQTNEVVYTEKSSQQPEKSEKTVKPAPKKNEKKEEVEVTEEQSQSSGNHTEIVAPMAGLVIEVQAKTGKKVEPGDKLLVLEAMKMENDIISDTSGIIKDVNCKKGDNVETGQVLITVS